MSLCVFLFFYVYRANTLLLISMRAFSSAGVAWTQRDVLSQTQYCISSLPVKVTFAAAAAPSIISALSNSFAKLEEPFAKLCKTCSRVSLHDLKQNAWSEIRGTTDWEILIRESLSSD